MNIELDEVVVLDVSDDALEMAAGGPLPTCWAAGAPYVYLRWCAPQGGLGISHC